MTRQFAVAGTVAVLGLFCLGAAVMQERRMHRHRQPGVTYRQATFRRDGGWRRSELFTPEGLQCQRQASRWGVIGGVLLVAGLLAWIGLGAR
jgi:hypothetical protein